MTLEEKNQIIEDLFDIDQSEFTPETELTTLGWDSMRALTCMVTFQMKLGKMLSGDELKEFKTIGDIMNAMD